MSSISTNSAESVGEYISKLKTIRDAESQRIYNLWNSYVKKAQEPGATVESIMAMLATDNIQIDKLMPQNERVPKSHFPKNLKTVEEYQYWLDKFKGRQKLNSSSWYYWDELVKIAKEEGATVDSIKAAVDKAKIKRDSRRKNNVEGVESPGTAADLSAATASSEVKLSGSPTPRAPTHVVNSKTTAPKKDINLRQKVAPSTHGSRGPEIIQVPADVSSGFYSIYTRASPQTSTTKAVAAPINKPQSKLPVPATSATSHSHPHSQFHSHSSSVSSARHQQQVVTSDKQRPRTPTKSTALASASQTLPRNTVTSPIATRTSHTVPAPPDQRLESPSPLNKSQKRKLSLGSEGASISNRSNQSKQLNQGHAGPPGENKNSEMNC